MSTPSRRLIPRTPLEAALQSVPKVFRDRILKSYSELKRRLAEAQHDSSWDASGLSAGKFCESVIRFLQEKLLGAHEPFGKHISNFGDECRKLIQTPEAAGHESLRVCIPRALVFLYTLRGKRDIGHVGGDVTANEIDALTVVRVCDWVMCELIRLHHGLSLEDAQNLVDALAFRSVPDIWAVGGKKRVMRVDLSYKDKTLLLLYSEPSSGVMLEDLLDWVEHSNKTIYCRDVLAPLHKDKLIEFNRDEAIVILSPLGTQRVESHLVKPAIPQDG